MGRNHCHLGFSSLYVSLFQVHSLKSVSSMSSFYFNSKERLNPFAYVQREKSQDGFESHTHCLLVNQLCPGLQGPGTRPPTHVRGCREQELLKGRVPIPEKGEGPGQKKRIGVYPGRAWKQRGGGGDRGCGGQSVLSARIGAPAETVEKGQGWALPRAVTFAEIILLPIAVADTLLTTFQAEKRGEILSLCLNQDWLSHSIIIAPVQIVAQACPVLCCSSGMMHVALSG